MIIWDFQQPASGEGDGDLAVSGALVPSWAVWPVSPAAGDGYIDGDNLYQAYLVPISADPSGNGSYKFDCVTIDVTIKGNGITISAVHSSDPKCCKCRLVLGRQWINRGGGWGIDNEVTHSDFYNFDSGVQKKDGKTTGVSPGGYKHDKTPGDLGGNGLILDAPTVGFFKFPRKWIACFYCKNGQSATLLGCVGWSESFPEGTDHAPVYSDDGKASSTGLPGADDPIGSR